ncbi:PREDICTED: circadian clock-controlled protein [Eufriesea mexicana]|uniref:circadian clock-controlled protein n=1 Tax=Eufriesea mexicana TaxID=516756 RepID=UPI00083C75F5|nr:PREDICTED: circadian clock-controlled protein [Eufriesea mexicana]
MKIIVVLGLVVATFGAAFARQLPEFIHTCKRDTPDLGNCMKNSVEDLQPYLKKGIPEYKIPSLEPLVLDELAASAGDIKLVLKNVTIHNASNFKIINLKANLSTLKFALNLELPSLQLTSHYDVDGKVLLRIQGNGPMECTLNDCKGIVKFQFEKSQGDDGQTYLKLVELKTTVSVGSGKLNLHNLFNGDQVLGEAVNSAINANFVAFENEIKPGIEKGISKKFTNIANSILTQFTYDDLFPES